MNKYKVTITETLKEYVNVEADSYEEAVEKVRDMYSNEDIVLTSDNYYDTDFHAQYLGKTKAKADKEREER